MSMNTYPLDEKAVLSVNGSMAAAILLHDTFVNDPDMLDPEIRKNISAGVQCWKIAENPKYTGWLSDNDFFNVSDAYDVLSNADVGNLVHCSEFQGDAQTADGFEELASSRERWDDDFVCLITPERSMSLFKAAYDGPQDLLDEYAKILDPYLGDGFNYAQHVVDISGTYFC